MEAVVGDDEIGSAADDDLRDSAFADGLQRADEGVFGGRLDKQGCRTANAEAGVSGQQAVPRDADEGDGAEALVCLIERGHSPPL